MGKAIRASLLVLLLACSAQAGYMPNGTPEPPPPEKTAQESNTNEDTTGAADTLIQTVLAVLASLLP